MYYHKNTKDEGDGKPYCSNVINKSPSKIINYHYPPRELINPPTMQS
ncbi:MAG: hypothetical protein DGJ47_001132 [Rickettsiaceae bacterium]